MNKIEEIIIGTNNKGKYKEICALLPKNVIKYSPKEFDILTPEETGTSFEKNSFIKASYFSRKTNLICLSDDSGLEIDLLKGQPGIYSSRWSGHKNNFDLAIKKVFGEMSKIHGEQYGRSFLPEAQEEEKAERVRELIRLQQAQQAQQAQPPAPVVPELQTPEPPQTAPSPLTLSGSSSLRQIELNKLLGVR